MYRNPKLERLIAQYPFQTTINLSYQQLTDEDLPIVIKQAIIRKKCTGLSLYSNEITARGISILADAIRDNTTLEKLYLWDNPIGDKGVRYLTEVVLGGVSILKDLRLGWTGITDEAVLYLAEMLKISNIFTDLWMRENKIGDYGVSLLMNVLAFYNSSLQVLWLRGNTLITDACVDSVITMLQNNQSLKQLSLELCGLSDLSKERLQKEANLKKDFSLWI